MTPRTRTTPAQAKTAQAGTAQPKTAQPKATQAKGATKAAPAAGAAGDKPATRRRTTRPGETAPPRTRARRSAGITVDDDTARFSPTADDAPDQVPAQPAPAPPPAPVAGPAARVPAPKKEWEAEIDESKVAISVRLPKSLKARLDGLTDYLALNDPDQFPDLIKQVANQTEVFNLGLHRFLTLAEDELNGGKPLPVLIRRR